MSLGPAAKEGAEAPRNDNGEHCRDAPPPSTRCILSSLLERRWGRVVMRYRMPRRPFPVDVAILLLQLPSPSLQDFLKVRETFTTKQTNQNKKRWDVPGDWCAVAMAFALPHPNMAKGQQNAQPPRGSGGGFISAGLWGFSGLVCEILFGYSKVEQIYSNKNLK